MRVLELTIGTVAVLSLAACASAPRTAASGGPASATAATSPAGPSFTTRSANAASSAASDTYDGLGGAAQQPMRDLNLIHDDVPPILVRAYARPYDMTGLDTCEGVSEQVRQLDLALGPDVDIPRGATPEKDMFAKGASLAADAALDTVRSAAVGFIPVRSWVRRFSGANRAEQEAKAVALSGAVRRGYLKAIGQAKGCEWPAAPLRPRIFKASVDAASSAPPAALASAGSQAMTAQPASPPIPASGAKPQN
jgi:hypothetical protein